MHKPILKNSYSLLELTVVITIISFVITSLLSVAVNKKDNDKVKDTLEKMQFIEKAIANYFAEYGAIPCPGVPTALSNGTGFGAASCANTSMWYYSASFSNIVLGSVPTNTLQIPDEYAYDAWGRRFTYSMIQQANASKIQYLAGYNDGGSTAANPNYNSSNNFSNSSSVLTVQNASGSPLSAVYVLLSHGRNGHGAYPHNGGNSRITSKTVVGANEVTNGLLSTAGATQTTAGVYIQKPLVYSNEASTYFDDIVHYRTKDQIIKEAGAFNTNDTYSQSICNMAKNITSTTDAATYCPLNLSATPTSPTTCQDNLYKLAAQINSLCF